MKIPKNWISALAIALSLPSFILTLGWLSMKLVELDILGKKTAILSFIILTSGMLGLLVLHGIKKKS